MEKWIPEEDIPAGEGRCFEVDGKHVAVFNKDGAFFGMAGSCDLAEQGRKHAPLQEVIDTCPNHDWRFDPKQGSCRFKPTVVEELSTLPSQARFWEVGGPDAVVEVRVPRVD